MSAVPFRLMTPPSSPALSSISARPAAAVEPLTSITAPAVVRMSPSLLLPAPACIHTASRARTLARIGLLASTSRLTSAPPRRLTVSVV